MTWINFLHLYQPANSDDYTIAEALNKSYWRLIRLMEENPDLRMTFNVSACLLERLYDMGETEFISRLRELSNSGRLELVGSASYHAFLPLVSKEEVTRQISEQEEILKKYLGEDLKLQGFFCPEMAFNEEVLNIIKERGYKWIILDEISLAENQDFDLNKIFKDEKSSLKIIFRSRKFSRAYPPDEIVNILQNDGDEKIIISATDAELYGLRHEDPTAELERIAADKKVKTKTISEFINSFGAETLVETSLRPSSWESEELDINKGEPFALWFGKKNKIHKDLWRLTNFALEIGEQNKHDENYEWFRWHLKRGIASCTYWWASAHDFSADFGPYTWSPDMVERGSGDLIRAVRSLSDLKTKRDKLKAEKYYLQLKKHLWREHWTKHWPQNK